MGAFAIGGRQWGLEKDAGLRIQGERGLRVSNVHSTFSPDTLERPA